MPHVIVKLWPGKSKEQKERLAERISQAVMDVLDYGEESVSVAMAEVRSSDWAKQVYQPDIKAKWDKLYRKPGYNLATALTEGTSL
ncbi:MAG TPA: tautomerase family protein [Stellaceae bacterium]|nr:tautomerase family protein [Stellaceae bacterium]